MRGTDLIDELRQRTSTKSDYGLALYLGVSRTVIHNIRREKQGLSPELAKRICELLPENAGDVLIWSYEWMAKDPETKAFWRLAGERAMCLAAGVLALSIAHIDDATAIVKDEAHQAIHYAKRRLLTLVKKLTGWPLTFAAINE